MPALPTIQPSFAAGELSPFLYGRVDLAKYHVGCRTLLNFFVHPHGGASNRAGTMFVGGVDDHTVRHRLIPFQFRTAPAGQTYALLLGHMTMQVVMNGGLVLDGGGNVYTLATPYAAADLPTLKFVQSADTMTLTHPGYAPRNLTRTGHAAWTLTVLTFAPTVQPPTNLVSGVPGAGNDYVVTAVDDTTGEESLQSETVSSSLTTSNVIWTAVPNCSRYNVYRSRNGLFGFVGNSDASGFQDTNVLPDVSNCPPGARNPFAPGAITGLTATAGGSGYSATPAIAINTSTGSGAVIVANVAAGAINSYTIRKAGHDYAPGDTITITDGSGSGAHATLAVGPTTGTYPACSSYYMQRQVFGGAANAPQTLVFSGTGTFNNMNVSQPTKDDDAITRTLVSRQVNEIRHFVPGQSLLVMTSGAEWRCYPGTTANALTPAACATLPQTAYGSSHVPPLSVGYNILFVQERGSRVREMAYDALRDNYVATDMSVLASHLFFDTTAQYDIQEWCFAQEPHQIAWAVRSDGLLLGFTYMKEHDVYAWHRHTTDGVVESVCSIAEGREDAVYLIVARTIGGATKRYVERMASRTFGTIADAWFVDCGLQYSGAPVTSVSGLDHLEGKTVAILGDGSVVPSQVVTGGAIQLDGPYAKVTVGLPYTADLETLNLELPAGGGTAQGQMKKIAQVTVRVKDARGIKVGIAQTMSGGVVGPATTEVKQRQAETLGSPMQPYNGDFAIVIPTEWNRDGRLFVRQEYPLPCTILDLIPEVNVGD